ncbi:uncharacterized protein LOC117592565 [Drosophila guanche]|uniref:Ionotropic glutamate receptor C-terminal domain-containing protein n=1 Tax=Drosophila guanche TaxID=7266 RepID=A0A3B0JHN5_DROGU|nr:uncharacterized protein LOC117592565 [Drosophila guanche]SPP74900.1 Hypothetical predicted protein [Drosophila guanche]
MWTVLSTLLLLWAIVIASESTVDFIRSVAKSSSLELLIIRYDYCPDSWLPELYAFNSLTVVLQSARSAQPQHEEFSRALHVVCLPGNGLHEEELLLQALATSLENRRNEKCLLYLANRLANPAAMDQMLRRCYELKMLNVVGLMAVDVQRFYYRYHPYPEFRVERRTLQASHIFEALFPNMQGEPLIVMPDQWHPRSVVYVDRCTGKKVLAGSVGRFARTLVWKLNATLEYAQTVIPGRFLNANTLRDLVKRLPIDLPVSVSHVEQMPNSSYPFELTHMCLMIPVANEIPVRDIYRHLSSVGNVCIALVIVYAYGLTLSCQRRLHEREVYLVDFLLNDRALRGVLGQSFQLTNQESGSTSKCIYLMLGIVGLNISCIFGAALETMLAQPPKQFQARSIADVRRARLPLVVMEEDLDSVADLQLPVLTVNASEYIRLRDEGNTSYVYLATRLHWTLFENQQKHFSRELFIYSKDACLWSLALLTFELPQHSWFEAPINKLILEARASGIYQYWVGMHHYDMSVAGVASLRDLSLQQIQRETHETGSSLRLIDLQWVWLAYGALTLLAVLLFILETGWQQLQAFALCSDLVYC